MSIDDGTKLYWSSLRTFSATLAESGTPSVGSFINLDYSDVLPEEIEIRFDSISVTGSPTSVSFDVWRYLGEKIDRIMQLTHVSADFSAPFPSVVRFDGGKLWITATFSDGSTPRVSTVAQVRVIK